MFTNIVLRELLDMVKVDEVGIRPTNNSAGMKLRRTPKFLCVTGDFGPNGISVVIFPVGVMRKMVPRILSMDDPNDYIDIVGGGGRELRLVSLYDKYETQVYFPKVGGCDLVTVSTGDFRTALVAKLLV